METTAQEKPVLTKDAFYKRIFSVEGMDEKRALLKELSESAKMLMELDPE